MVPLGSIERRPTHPEAHAEARSILVVDDDEDGGALLCLALQSRGWSPTAVPSSAVDTAVAARDVDAIVADLRPAGARGLVLCRRIHRDAPAVPLVALAGEGPPCTELEARQAGAAALLDRPVEIGRLVTTIRRVIARTPSSAAFGPPALRIPRRTAARRLDRARPAAPALIPDFHEEETP